MNDECPMTNDEWRQCQTAWAVCALISSFVIRHSSFLSLFVIRHSSFVICTLVLSWPSTTAGATVTSLDDIQFWVGAGANRAGLVIDWMEDANEPPALAWGYRWDGVATGRDMLLAVVTADDRLFAKLGMPPMQPGIPDRVFGIGYDANNDGVFGDSDFTPFDSAGIAITGPADGAFSTDGGDYYSEGWFGGLWHYGTATGNPFAGGSWHTSFSGMVGRTLADGAWDSWTFTPDFDFTAFATNPVAAQPPTGLPGDYNGDHVVDARDYDVWTGELGATGIHAADGSDDGIVNAADYVIWRDQLGASAQQIASNTRAVPEPCIALFALASFTFLSTQFGVELLNRSSQRSQRKETSVKKTLAIRLCVLCSLLLRSLMKKEKFQ